ncbi:small acidic protein family-domain-containing protein [Nemania sp. FL0031]|nr:small acidic protein family-domain-containing protein [Nemania sp. FL0031]
MDGDGPWEKVDVGNLRHAAEAKEAKLAQKLEQRLLRAKNRKEKRNAKAEAKQARRLNAKQATKWTPERKAIDKEKKLATRSQKKEKRRKRMRVRAEKLEAQARKLWAEAQKARARADVLDKMKSDEEEGKKKLKKAAENTAQDPETEDYIPLEVDSSSDEDSDEDSTTLHIEKKKSKGEKTPQDKALDQITERELGPSITANEQNIDDEAGKKQKRKEGKRAEKRKRGLEEEGALETANADGADRADRKEKKKKRKVETSDDDHSEEEIEAEKTISKKEKKKKDKKEHAVEESEATEVASTNGTPKEKKEKKKKREKKEKQPAEEPVSASPVEGEASTNGGEQWNVSHLEGDAKRKQKFLRLLGGGKANGVAGSDPTPSTSSKADITKMQSDLERQFDVGMKMKQEGHSHRRGLGA